MCIQFLCEMFINCIKNFIGIWKKIQLPNMEYYRDHRFEGQMWVKHVKHLRLSA